MAACLEFAEAHVGSPDSARSGGGGPGVDEPAGVRARSAAAAGRKSPFVPWTDAEDGVLRELAPQYMLAKPKPQWVEVAQELAASGVSPAYRGPKLCRDRW
eukprot:COSAG01_NODE_7907_length_2997_cov_28.082471_3_plen_101_part_00